MQMRAKTAQPLRAARFTVHRVYARVPPLSQLADTATSQQRAQQLKDWVSKHSEGKLATQLSVKPRLAGDGFGMFTEEPVSRGQVLVRVPYPLMMTQASACADPEYGALLSNGAATEWQALVLHLLAERARGASSFWAPYIAILPPQAQHPLAWGPAQRAQLHGSPMLATLAARQQQVADDVEALCLLGANELPVAVAWLAQHPGRGELVSMESVTWAAAVLLSRAFSLDTADDEPVEGDLAYFGSWQAAAPDVLALVPWADSLCHSSRAGAESCLRFSAELQAASLCAHAPYAVGEEVFDSYGPGLSPPELLLDYGFVDPVNDNHRVEAPAESIAQPRTARSKLLLAALAGAQEGAAMPLVVGPQGPDLSGLAWLRAALSSDAELVRAGWRVKATEKDTELACRVMGSLSQPGSRDTEALVLAALAAWLQAALAAYPSSLEADQEELEQPTTPWLRRQVLLALSSEKIALRGAALAVQQWQAQLEGGADLDTLYASLMLADDGDDEDEAVDEEEWSLAGGLSSGKSAAATHQSEDDDDSDDDDDEEDDDGWGGNPPVPLGRKLR